MYVKTAAFWTNKAGKLCCDVSNKRSQSPNPAKAKWYGDKQQKRIVASDKVAK